MARGPTKDVRSLLAGVQVRLKACTMRKGRAQVNTRWGDYFKKHMQFGEKRPQASPFLLQASSQPASSRSVARRVRRRRWHPVLSSSRRTVRTRVIWRPAAVARSCAHTRSRLRRAARPVRRLRLTIVDRRAAALLRVEMRVGRSAVGIGGRSGHAGPVGRPARRKVWHTSAAHARRVGDLEGVDLRAVKRLAVNGRRREAAGRTKEGMSP